MDSYRTKKNTNKNKCKITKKIDDLGVSLVELIVIIAIMAILSTGLISMIGLLTGRAARECAQDTLSSLSRIRVLTLSKSQGAPESGIASAADVYLEIAGDGKGHIIISQIVNGETVDEISVSAPNIEIRAVVGGSEIDLTGQSIILGYDRATGAFLKYSDLGYMTSLTFDQGKTYTIKMIPTTGKSELE